MDCFNCGHNLIWQSDFMLSELEGIDYDDDNDRVVNVLYCPHCHSDVWVMHPSPNMYKEYQEEEESENEE